jgi:hypothetical protein
VGGAAVLRAPALKSRICCCYCCALSERCRLPPAAAADREVQKELG